MIPRFCTLVRRSCRVNAVNRLIKSTEIRPGNLTEATSTLVRSYGEKSETIINEESRNLSQVALAHKGYESGNAKNTEDDSDRGSVHPKECTGNRENHEMTVVPKVSNDTQINPLNDDIDLKLPDALDECTEDLSYVAPYIDPPRTFAYIAESSQTVQQLIKLGVKLYKLEKNYETFKKVSELDFKRDIEPRVRYFTDLGVPPHALGNMFTKSPNLLLTSLRILHSRIGYLKAQQFTNAMISTMIVKQPTILELPIKKLDARLGALQQAYHLTNTQVRELAVHQPRLVTYHYDMILRMTGNLKEVLRFDNHQVKQLLLSRPTVFIKSASLIVDSCIYAMEEMKLERDDIIKHSQILLCKKPRLERRHKFLVELKKAQFDPKLPNYIPLVKLVEGTDEQFCQEVAKCDIDLYNAFLKTF